MSWRESVAKEIKNTKFLEKTTTIESLKQYIRSELKSLDEELRDLARTGALIKAKDSDNMVIFHLPSLKFEKKGIMVEDHEEGKSVLFYAISYPSLELNNKIAEITPRDTGAIVSWYDENGSLTHNEFINPSTLDKIFSKVFY